MQLRTPIFIVTSSRPRVGKTLVARVLTEYFLARQASVAAFDVNPGELKLVDHLPACTTAASLDDVRGEMALFDRLVAADGAAKVVDLGHMALERFFAVMREINFAVEARRRGMAPMTLYLADPDERAERGYANLLERFPELPLLPVFNGHVPPILHHRLAYPVTLPGGEPIAVATLTPVVRSVVDRRHFSFIEFARKADPTSELYQWMAGAFLAFHELEVRLLLGEAAPRLKHSA